LNRPIQKVGVQKAAAIVNLRNILEIREAVISLIFNKKKLFALKRSLSINTSMYGTRSFFVIRGKNVEMNTYIKQSNQTPSLFKKEAKQSTFYVGKV
jgi:hypothetical protein